jgi:hypothetical protein
MIVAHKGQLKPRLEPLPVERQAANQQNAEAPENQRVHNARASFLFPSDQALLAETQGQQARQALLQMVGSIGGLEGLQQLDFSDHRPAENDQGDKQQNGHQQGIHSHLGDD